MEMETKYVKAILLLLLCCLSLFCYVAKAARPAVAGGGFSGAVIDVLQFGAKPDGKDSNMKFIRAWNKACQTPGAKLLIPAGEFLAGPVVFQGPCKGPIIVEVIGTIKAQPDISLYDADFWFSFENIDGLTLTGKGTFDGQGAQSWRYNDCKTNPNCQNLPSNLKFSKVKNAIVEGIQSLNSMGYHLNIVQNDHFLVQNILIRAPAKSPNTDGIHISQSSVISITRSIIRTGEDCVSIIQDTTSRVSITDVACGGHGPGLGISVKNCIPSRTNNEVRIKSGSPPTNATKCWINAKI